MYPLVQHLYFRRTRLVPDKVRTRRNFSQKTGTNVLEISSLLFPDIENSESKLIN